MALTKIQGLAVDNVPCFFMKGNNNAHVNTSPVVFGLTVIDTHSGVDLTNNKYVVPIAGKWQFQLPLVVLRWTMVIAITTL